MCDIILYSSHPTEANETQEKTTVVMLHNFRQSSSKISHNVLLHCVKLYPVHVLEANPNLV